LPQDPHPSTIHHHHQIHHRQLVVIRLHDHPEGMELLYLHRQLVVIRLQKVYHQLLVLELFLHLNQI
jgi:hypothetical protein